MATPHINAKKGEIAKLAVLCGDPLRAKIFAETFLADFKLVNTVRNMFAYTGTYKCKKITIMSVGMGIASMGIYASEIFREYGVEKAIRAGTCCSLNKNIKIGDIIVADKTLCSVDFAKGFSGKKVPSTANDMLLDKCKFIAKNKNIPLNIGTVFTSLYFDGIYEKRKKSIGLEMETHALYVLANLFGKQALSILTVSDSHFDKNKMSSKEREQKTLKMCELALEVLIR